MKLHQKIFGIGLLTAVIVPHLYEKGYIIKLRPSLADLLRLFPLNNSLHFYNLETFIQFPSAYDRRRSHSLRESKFVGINQPSLTDTLLLLYLITSGSAVSILFSLSDGRFSVLPGFSL
jgi:hypothetical protein